MKMVRKKKVLWISNTFLFALANFFKLIFSSLLFIVLKKYSFFTYLQPTRQIYCFIQKSINMLTLLHLQRENKQFPLQYIFRIINCKNNRKSFIQIKKNYEISSISVRINCYGNKQKPCPQLLCNLLFPFFPTTTNNINFF